MTNYYCTVRGTIATATIQEIFQHSICVSSPTNQTDTANAIASTFLAAWGTGSTKLSQFVNSQVTYTECTAAQINHLIPTGDNDLQAATHAPFAPILTGGGSGPMLPAQNAVAISLTGGARPNGSSYKGRFYLPPFSTTAVTTGGLMSAGVRNPVNAWAAEWLANLKFVGAVPCIWSRKAGVLSPVASVRTGDRVDTIRSRRNKGVETYISAVIT